MKAVKKLERLESTSHALGPEENAMYRALSARANDLAQDRPDIAFSTKELCREFAIPNKDSYAKLERVVSYLIGIPRLVYVYDWQACSRGLMSTLTRTLPVARRRGAAHPVVP